MPRLSRFECILQLPILVNSRAHYWLLVSLLVSGALLASYLLAVRQAPEKLELSDYQSFACETGGAGQDTLRLLTLTSLYTPEMATRLCRRERVAVHFVRVNIAWRPRRFIGTRDILEQRYDLFWNRQHLVLGMVPSFYDYYSPLLHTPRYPVYWLGHAPIPEISPGFLEGKRVGLLSDTSSQTFYLRPMDALHRAGIALDDSQKRLYPEIGALYRAFRRGEVDLISSPLFLAERLNVPSEHRHLIAREVPSGTWYISNRLLGSGVECDLLEAVSAMEPLFRTGATPAEPAEGIACP